MMLHMKFDNDQSAGLWDIHVWKSGQTDGRRLGSHPIRSSWLINMHIEGLKIKKKISGRPS